MFRHISKQARCMNKWPLLAYYRSVCFHFCPFCTDLKTFFITEHNSKQKRRKSTLGNIEMLLLYSLPSRTDFFCLQYSATPIAGQVWASQLSRWWWDTAPVLAFIKNEIHFPLKISDFFHSKIKVFVVWYLCY